MLLALEYVLRNKVLENCIKFPISIFIEHQHWNNKVVITITKKKDKFCVKHWYISGHSKEYLPSFAEFYIDDIFNSDKVVVPNYYLLKFSPPTYLYRRQLNEAPAVQSQQYMDYISGFFNPPSNEIKRLNWLWESFSLSNKEEFEKYCSNYSYPYFGYSSISELLENQRDKIFKVSKRLWNNWLMWRKFMLDFEQDVAPEILFQPYYMKKYEEQNDKLGHMLPAAYI